MKHRHKLAQAKRHKAASPGKRSEADDAADEQPQPASGRAKKRVRHEMHVEGGRPKFRLDKFRRGGRSRSKKYDIGGAAPPGGGGANLPTTPSLSDFAFTAKPNPIVKMVQANLPPVDTAGKIMAARAQAAGQQKPVFPLPSRAPGSPTAIRNKQGGRIGQRRFDDGGGVGGRNPDDPGGELASANKSRKSTADWIKDEIMGGTKPAYARGGRQRAKHYDDGGSIADASPVATPNLAFGDGPPPPPRASDDGMATAAAPPRANNPSFVNSLNAAQKRAAMTQRIKRVEGKGR
jgi:hypothetical protein